MQRIQKAADLLALRNAAKLSQDEVAKRAGLNASTIGRIERGYFVPRPETLRRVIEAILGERADV